jgi:hypothetical protein
MAPRNSESGSRVLWSDLTIIVLVFAAAFLTSGSVPIVIGMPIGVLSVTASILAILKTFDAPIVAVESQPERTAAAIRSAARAIKKEPTE